MTQAEETDRPARSLWRDRDFGIFWAAQTLSVAGDSFAYIAVPLLVLHATGSVAQMGLLTGVAGAASICAGIFAGVLVDRLDRRTLLICCDLARMVLYGLVPLVWAFGPQVWLLYVVLPLGEAVGMVFQVTYVTAVRTLAGEDRVTEANGRLYATAAAAGVLGPSLAGVVSGQFGPTAALGVNAASFGLSAIGVFLIRLGGSSQNPAGTAPPLRQRPSQELLAGARFLWRHPVLRTLTVLLSFFIFLTLGLTDVVIYHLKHGLGQSDAAVGAVLGAAAVGTVVGALLTPPLRRRLGFGASWIGAMVICGLAVAGLGASGDVWGVAVLVAVYLGCVSVAGICSMSLRQQVTPDHLLGRVTSAFWTIHFSLGPVGAALLAWGAEKYGVATVYLVSGTGCLSIALIALCTPVRQARPEHSGKAA
ncbi:MFS transporter [Planomonospora sp. ID67723]|uniref:MFS transporter n=1 Tax=Planomonospora sp. ID67723 TaxID=2738134 RepID=UPI0018C37955|nr:MFS transporter [Planomonospora sp. ID67723]MBG0831109.1 MFS transporter [Planomonospora sp. ID67723]